MIPWILFIIFGLIQVVDIYTTIKVLDIGGKEYNPIMRFLIEKFGKVKALIGSKIIILAILGYLIAEIGGLPIIIGLVILIVFYAYILYKNNIRALLGNVVP